MPITQNSVGTRLGTSAEWAASTLVLAPGEEGVATDTGESRLGDGTNTWGNLTSTGREGRATLVAGTVTVANTSITAKTIIMLTHQTNSGQATMPAVGVSARVNGTSFTILSSAATDTSVIGYTLVEGP